MEDHRGGNTSMNMIDEVISADEHDETEPVLDSISSNLSMQGDSSVNDWHIV